MTTVVFTVTGMHCSSCSMLIDESIEDLSGVRRSHTDFRRGETTVDFAADILDPSTIVRAIEHAGYKAEPRATP